MRNTSKRLFLQIEEASPSIGKLFRRITGRTRVHGLIRQVSGNNNIIQYRNGVLNNVRFNISGNNNLIEISDDCHLSGLTFYIKGNNNRVHIGEHCRFGPGSCIWMDDHGCELQIGSYSSFEQASLNLPESGTRIDIGERCMFAHHIELRTGDSHSIVSAETGERLNHGRNISIADHVWVGAHSILLKGSELARDSVVATGSVVTKPFAQPGIIIGGNPAKILKQGINWDRERLHGKERAPQA